MIAMRKERKRKENSSPQLKPRRDDVLLRVTRKKK